MQERLSLSAVWECFSVTPDEPKEVERSGERKALPERTC